MSQHGLRSPPDPARLSASTGCSRAVGNSHAAGSEIRFSRVVRAPLSSIGRTARRIDLALHERSVRLPFQPPLHIIAYQFADDLRCRAGLASAAAMKSARRSGSSFIVNMAASSMTVSPL